MILKRGYEYGEKKDVDIHCGMLSLHLTGRVNDVWIASCMCPSLRLCSRV